jgi:hypothetical protein
VRILLVNDNSAHPNWGAQATPYSLIRILKSSIRNVEIDALSWDWLRRTWWCLSRPLPSGRFIRPEQFGTFWPIVRRLSHPVEFYPAIADDFDALADAWMAGDGGPDGAEFISRARAADVVIYSGENSIYRNTMEGCHGLFLLWLAKTRLGKSSCLVNHTADLNEVRAIMNGMVQLVDPVLDLVAAREPRSLRNLHSFGISSAVLYPDVVFAEDPRDHAEFTVDRWLSGVGLGDAPYFCLSASGLPMSAPRAAWVGAVGELVDSLKALGLYPVLVGRDPHCQFLADVARRTGGAFFGPEHQFAELWPLFTGARLSVTGHFHYIIIGSSVGCPFIPLSNNNHKISGVCEMLEWHRTEPFDATWLASCRDEIVAEAKRIIESRDELSSKLLARSAVLREQARALGDRVRDIAGGTPGARQP